MPPTDRFVCRFSAEPPQEGLPYGRWAEALAERFVDACGAVEAEDDLGAPGEVSWFPDRTFAGRTYVPASTTTTNGYELFGYVSYEREHEGAEATAFEAVADWTDETAEANPDWVLDLSDREITTWRGPQGRRGEITLVWGVTLTQNGVVATAELGPTTTDQCAIVEDRFTLVSLDSYGGDYLEVKLWGAGGGEVASESLYEDDDE